MNSDIQIIDNYLPEEEFRNIQSIIFSKSFPWYFDDYSVYPDDGIPQLVHPVYSSFEPRSDLWGHIFPILTPLENLRSILRIKLNLDVKDSEVKVKAFHYDQVDDEENVVPHQVLILYMNTCNGYTLFEDGTKIDSVENRAIIFPGEYRHTGTTCTDQTKRIVLNLNYL